MAVDDVADLGLRELTSDEYRKQQWAQMSERTWGLRFERMCRELGWAYYHTFNSQHSAGGYPDYHCIRGGDEFYAELKTEKGKLTAKQENWRDLLVGAGNEWELYRPSDEDRVLERLNAEYREPKGE